MQLNVKTILNLKEKNPRFVYRDVRLTECARRCRREQAARPSNTSVER
jgi:hypothetical protein